MQLTLTDLEQAINHWRSLKPSFGEERALSAEVNRLADVYALMIWERRPSVPMSELKPEVVQLIEAWRASTGAGYPAGS